MELKIEYLPVGELKAYDRNTRKHQDKDVTEIAKSIEKYGFSDPIGVWGEKNIIVEGHGRLLAARKLGIETVPVIHLDHLTDEERREYAIMHNRTAELSGWDFEMLAKEMEELDLSEFDLRMDGLTLGDEYEQNPQQKYEQAKTGVLASKFLAPPFSILDSRKGYWKERKAEWHNLLPDSREGRDKELLGKGLYDLAQKAGSKTLNGTSEFDPVLCEIIYQWFAPAEGKVIDPFAGGHVRGTIADVVGLHYTGIELRPEQVENNNKVKEEYGIKNATWICDDSLNVDKHIKDESADFIIACPPYADLEKYSDDPRDISNMDYEEFIKVYEEIIARFIKKLKQNTFAVFVVGDVRDSKGFYYDFISDTKRCFINNGMKLYNEIILIESMATAALRAKQFAGTRKVIKGHQNVLVFYKGDQLEQKKHVLVFYKGNPKEIKEFEIKENELIPITQEEETEEAVKTLTKVINDSEEDDILGEDYSF